MPAPWKGPSGSGCTLAGYCDRQRLMGRTCSSLTWTRLESRHRNRRRPGDVTSLRESASSSCSILLTHVIQASRAKAGTGTNEGSLAPFAASSYWRRGCLVAREQQDDKRRGEEHKQFVRRRRLELLRSVMDLQFLAASFVESQPAVPALCLWFSGAGRNVRLRSQSCHESCTWAVTPESDVLFFFLPTHCQSTQSEKFHLTMCFLSRLYKSAALG